MQDTDKEYVSCYNCCGQNMQIMCGMPMLGCLLCETHGQGFGRLDKAYRYKAVSIHNDETGEDESFVPPSYVCVQCRDTSKMMQRLWIDSMVDNMPQVEVACFKCNPEQNKKDMEEAKKKYE